MNPWQQKVKTFMQAMGQHTPSELDLEHWAALAPLRKALIEEEAREVAEAIDAGDIPALAKELSDLLYVLLGAAVALGIDLDPCFAAVHASNLSKLDPISGKPVHRADGKVLKGPGYQPPEIGKLLRERYGFQVPPPAAAPVGSPREGDAR